MANHSDERAAQQLEKIEGRTLKSTAKEDVDIEDAYEKNKVERLGADAARPHRATYRKLTRG